MTAIIRPLWSNIGLGFLPILRRGNKRKSCFVPRTKEWKYEYSVFDSHREAWRRSGNSIIFLSFIPSLCCRFLYRSNMYSPCFLAHNISSSSSLAKAGVSQQIFDHAGSIRAVMKRKETHWICGWLPGLYQKIRAVLFIQYSMGQNGNCIS